MTRIALPLSWILLGLVLFCAGIAGALGLAVAGVYPVTFGTRSGLWAWFGMAQIVVSLYGGLVGVGAALASSSRRTRLLGAIAAGWGLGNAPVWLLWTFALAVGGLEG